MLNVYINRHGEPEEIKKRKASSEEETRKKMNERDTKVNQDCWNIDLTSYKEPNRYFDDISYLTFDKCQVLNNVLGCLGGGGGSGGKHTPFSQIYK